MNFKQELIALLNKHCIDSMAMTPDYIIAEFLIDCLDSFSEAVRKRHNWYQRTDVNDVKVSSLKEK